MEVEIEKSFIKHLLWLRRSFVKPKKTSTEDVLFINDIVSKVNGL